jgi:hypothetical protein
MDALGTRAEVFFLGKQSLCSDVSCPPLLYVILEENTSLLRHEDGFVAYVGTQGLHCAARVCVS